MAGLQDMQVFKSNPRPNLVVEHGDGDEAWCITGPMTGLLLIQAPQGRCGNISQGSGKPGETPGRLTKRLESPKTCPGSQGQFGGDAGQCHVRLCAAIEVFSSERHRFKQA